MQLSIQQRRSRRKKQSTLDTWYPRTEKNKKRGEKSKTTQAQTNSKQKQHLNTLSSLFYSIPSKNKNNSKIFSSLLPFLFPFQFLKFSSSSNLYILFTLSVIQCSIFPCCFFGVASESNGRKGCFRTHTSAGMMMLPYRLLQGC